MLGHEFGFVVGGGRSFLQCMSVGWLSSVRVAEVRTYHSYILVL